MVNDSLSNLFTNSYLLFVLGQKKPVTAWYPYPLQYPRPAPVAAIQQNNTNQSNHASLEKKTNTNTSPTSINEPGKVKGDWSTQQQSLYLKGNASNKINKVSLLRKVLLKENETETPTCSEVKKKETKTPTRDTLSQRERVWQDHYNTLLEFKRQNGHSVVPNPYHPNKVFGGWVEYQRSEYKKGALSKEKIAKLNDASFCWNAKESRWNQRYSELMIYRQEHGHCLVPQKYEPNPPLGHWVICQRKHFRMGILKLDRIKRLNEIGFSWEVRNLK